MQDLSDEEDLPYHIWANKNEMLLCTDIRDDWHYFFSLKHGTCVRSTTEFLKQQERDKNYTIFNIGT